MIGKSANNQISIHDMEESQYNEIKKAYEEEGIIEKKSDPVDFVAKKNLVTITGYNNRTVLFQGLGAMVECNRWKKSFENKLTTNNFEFSGYLSLIIEVIFGKKEAVEIQKKRKYHFHNHKHSLCRFLENFILPMVIILSFSWGVSMLFTEFKYTEKNIDIIQKVITASIPPYIGYLIEKFKKMEEERKNNKEKLKLISNLVNELKLTRNALLICENYVGGFEKRIRSITKDEMKIKQFVKNECDNELILTLLNRINLSILTELIKHEKMNDEFIIDIQSIYYSLEELLRWREKVDVLEFKEVLHDIGDKIMAALELIDNHVKKFNV